MYTLRIIEETRADEKLPFDQVIINCELGDTYTKFCKGNSPLFAVFLNDYPEECKKQIRDFIQDEKGKLHPIFSNDLNHTWNYFIMTDSGKTFERL